MIDICLKPGREVPVRAGHPWIFSGAIAAVHGKELPGSLAQIVAADHSLLGIGYYNPRCSIAVRMLTRRDEAIDSAFFLRRMTAALALRKAILPPQTSGYRVINGEGDFLPGFIVDNYGDFLICQFLTAGAEHLKPLFVEALAPLLSPRGVYEKSEGGVRQEEGLANTSGVLWGEAPPPLVSMHENGCQFFVDMGGGQKTGFFLDQRDNRALLGFLAAGKTVLNGFAYSGGFGLVAAKYGAQRVVSVDSSARALQLARKNWHANAILHTKEEYIQADMFSYLRETYDVFDIIVLDPPPFIRRRHDLKAGLTGYKELNRQAFRLLPPGGQLLTFSCSQHLSSADFLQAVLFAAADARRSVQILKHLGPAPDHPVNLMHSEGSYLKGLWLRVGG